GASAATGGQSSDAVLVKAAAPNYPRPALQAQQTGWVVVAFTIDVDGRPRDVKVVDSQPRIVFDHAAVDAVNRYRFTPAMKDGVAVSSTRQQKIEFNL
ncbi:MAG: energy transducer TonB, partial [Rhodanobacter sp.]